MAQDDIRARRAARVKQDKFKNFLPQYGKYILVAVILVAAIGAAATFYKAPAPKKFAHEHPAFAIFADGQQYHFNDPAYDIREVSDKVHIHYDGNLDRASTWHVEANFPNGIPDLSIADIFGQYSVQVRKGYLKLDSRDGHKGEEWADSGNKTWRVAVSKARVGAEGLERQPFEELKPGSALLPEGPARDGGDYSKYIARDLDKILLSYGASDEEFVLQQGRVPEPRP